ncbi:hypothetical protein A6E19_07695 [Pseudomonas putida]|nr:hypothetical protein AB688_10110 [Pseudomonas putida]OCT25104.1 hypothetical protein A6E24_14420 [Pseudomonas putida]OCT29091.1 hypothetical protein A6E23_05570 [Pseudomonas putida]OCT39440.1 hypothetical protein A6E19_07695 [Pseudomonas putida]
MVSGLVSQTRLTAMGRLPRTGIARLAASSICMGMGMSAANNPTPMARATEWRFRCQRLGSCSNRPKKRKDLCSRMLVGSGM